MRYFEDTDRPRASSAGGDELLLKLCEKLAVAAGRLLLPAFQPGLAQAGAAGHAALAAAERAAEAVIVRGLAGTRSCIVEPATEATIAGRQLGAEFFLIDALDGGAALLAGRAEFTVNIALVRDGRPVLGVVFAPGRRALYAGSGGGATLALLDRDLRRSKVGPIAVRPRPRQPRIVASRAPLTAASEAYLRQWPQAEVVALASSLKFCLIASGEADLYPCFGRSMEWHTAAGHAVLLAAGGSVRGPDGQPLAYGKIAQADVDFAQPCFIADGAAARHWPLEGQGAPCP